MFLFVHSYCKACCADFCQCTGVSVINCKLCFLDSVQTETFKHCMVLTCIIKITHNILSVTDVYLKEIINLFLVSWVIGILKNLNAAIFLDIINVINVNHQIMVLLTELYLFIPLSVTMTIFQDHSSVKQFELKIYGLIWWNWNIVWLSIILLDHEYTTVFDFHFVQRR